MVSIQPGNAVNVVTEFRYGPGGRLEALIAKNPETGDQVTRYEYGTTLADSDVASNDLLRAEVYPDAVNSTDRVTYSYNRQGQRTKMTDQNGSVHEYDFEGLGRQTADKVTTLANGMDGAVRRIGKSYEVRGMVEKVTSYSDATGTTVVNEVQNAYNSKVGCVPHAPSVANDVGLLALAKWSAQWQNPGEWKRGTQDSGACRTYPTLLYRYSMKIKR